MPDTTKMFPTDLNQETPAGTHHILADDGTEAYDLLISALAAYILAGYATESWVSQQGYLTAETDPTVPSWAKASTKPSYSYSEISGTPTIPTKTSDLVNDSGFLTAHQDISGLQTKSITDTGGYYTTDTVEGALQEIGAEIAGVNTLIGTGVIS